MTTEKSKLNNFYQRAISSLVMVPVVLYAIYEGGILYFLLIALVAVLASYEFTNITGRLSFGLDDMVFITTVLVSLTTFYMNHIVLGLVLVLAGSYLTYIVAKFRIKQERNNVMPAYINRAKLFFIGCLYIALSISALGYLANLKDNSMTIVWLAITVMVGDTSAYIFGSIIKGKKIAPKISPGKTWSGFIAAVISSAIIGYIFAAVYSSNELLLMLISIGIAVFAHIGDFFESFYKRYLQIKDTSNLIPGHGGVLDRVDATMMVAIYIAVLSIIIGKSPLFLA